MCWPSFVVVLAKRAAVAAWLTVYAVTLSQMNVLIKSKEFSSED